jgi:hypothetical protein
LDAPEAPRAPGVSGPGSGQLSDQISQARLRLFKFCGFPDSLMGLGLEGSDLLPEFFHALCLFFDKTFIVKAFFYDRLKHCVDQGDFRPRSIKKGNRGRKQWRR